MVLAAVRVYKRDQSDLEAYRKIFVKYLSSLRYRLNHLFSQFETKSVRMPSIAF